MCDVKKEVDNTDLVIRNHVIKNYDLVYYASNEELFSIFSNFDFHNKSALTVLASGDQAFHFYDNNIGSLDFFDFNKFTIYYFYLRIWNIEKNNEFYLPPYFFAEYINDLINNVNPKTDYEEKALLYWRLLLEKFENNEPKLHRFFREGFTSHKNKIKDLERIKKAIQNRDFNFNIFDISHDISINKMYDIIYASNIFDWLDECDYEKYADNLYNLLNDNGIIICSDLSKRYGASIEEKRLYNEKFDYHQIPISGDNYLNHISGYYFKKR